MTNFTSHHFELEAATIQSSECKDILIPSRGCLEAKCARRPIHQFCWPPYSANISAALALREHLLLHTHRTNIGKCDLNRPNPDASTQRPAPSGIGHPRSVCERTGWHNGWGQTLRCLRFGSTNRRWAFTRRPGFRAERCPESLTTNASRTERKAPVLNRENDVKTSRRLAHREMDKGQATRK
jgi:hypothetical protein